jgi:uncharacterized FlaG/YvyC family protein
MDIQKINAIDNAAVDHKQKIEKLQESHDIRHIDQYEEEAKNAKDDQQIESQEAAVAMNTLKYAYNSTTGDLVMKITNADGSIGQYPTDSMMKLKALLKEEFITK